MSNDDDMLEAFDLSAWEAPPPPADLADAVIDRMGGTDVGIAVPVEDRGLRRGWVIAGVAAAVVVLGLGVWSLLRATHHAAPASGGVVADKPRTLSLDTVHATLDAGADVRWRRDGDVLRVEQRAGTVMWHVDGGEKLVIDAGAASASVEATGANLRVEVQMNAMDARVIGASALTAAAVAVVSVVVYEGHVKVGKPNQQTVVVAPGTTYKVNAVDDTAPVVGSAPVGTGKLAILGLEAIAEGTNDAHVVARSLSTFMRTVAAGEGPYRLAPGGDRELVDEKLMLDCASEAPDCMAAIGAGIGADVLVFGRLERRADAYTVTAKLFDVAQRQVKRTAVVSFALDDDDEDRLGDHARRVVLDLFGATATTCDADAFKDEAMTAITQGAHAQALAKLELSLACRADSYVVQLAFMESCASSNSAKAKLYYKQLTPAQQQKFAMMCIRNKVAYLDDGDSADSCAGVDEVACVLNNYQGDCCKRYQPATKPEGLTRADISAAIAKVRSKITACGNQPNPGGKLVARMQVRPDGVVKEVEITTSPDDTLTACVKVVLETAKFPATKTGGAFSYPFSFDVRQPAKSCDAKQLIADAKEKYANGQQQAASVLLEQAIKCETSTESYELAFMTACNLKDTTKVAKYWKRLPASSQDKLKQVCLRNGIDPADVPAATTCDADALKDDGMQKINMGLHAAALAVFEKSLACKQDPYVTQLAFMEACASHNSPKAKQYYKQMTASQQQKFAQMCKRNNVGYLDGPVGYLQIDSKPPAKIFVDGNDSGLTTPIRGQGLELTPGKHKITFLVDGERFTYPVVIKEGETQTMSKDLQ